MIILPASKNSFGLRHLSAGAARLFAVAPGQQTARAHQLTRGLCVFTAGRRSERALYYAEALRSTAERVLQDRNKGENQDNLT